jgi:hypothetical protein
MAKFPSPNVENSRYSQSCYHCYASGKNGTVGLLLFFSIYNAPKTKIIAFYLWIRR